MKDVPASHVSLPEGIDYICSVYIYIYTLEPNGIRGTEFSGFSDVHDFNDS